MIPFAPLWGSLRTPHCGRKVAGESLLRLGIVSSGRHLMPGFWYPVVMNYVKVFKLNTNNDAIEFNGFKRQEIVVEKERYWTT